MDRMNDENKKYMYGRLVLGVILLICGFVVFKGGAPVWALIVTSLAGAAFIIGGLTLLAGYGRYSPLESADEIYNRIESLYEIDAPNITIDTKGDLVGRRSATTPLTAEFVDSARTATLERLVAAGNRDPLETLSEIYMHNGRNYHGVDINQHLTKKAVTAALRDTRVAQAFKEARETLLESPSKKMTLMLPEALTPKLIEAMIHESGDSMLTARLQASDTEAPKEKHKIIDNDNKNQEYEPLMATEGNANEISLVENIVENLLRAQSGKAFCYIVLFGNRPLTAPMKGDECACIFSKENLATAFINGYKSHYACQRPLSILTIKSAVELWTIIHAKSSDPVYKLPLGLIINFSYSGGAFQNYSVVEVEGMGASGLAKGLQSIL